MDKSISTLPDPARSTDSTRAYDEGRVYLRPAYTESNGKHHKEVWVAEVSVGHNPITGKRQRTRAYAATKQEAQKKLKALKHSKARDEISPAPKRLTIAALFDEWLEQNKPIIKDGQLKGGWAPSTYKGYHIRRLNIVKVIGSVKLNAFDKPREGQRITQGLIDHYKRILDPQTVKHIRDVLRNALSYAVSKGYLDKNILLEHDRDAVKITLPPILEKDVVWLDVDDVVKLKRANADDPYLPLYLLNLYCALRPGEGIGTLREDINWTTGDLDLSHNLQEVTNIEDWTFQGLILKDVKTHRRKIHHVPADALDLLRQQLKGQTRLMAKSGWVGSRWPTLVFTTDNGEPLREAKVLDAFRLALKRAALDTRANMYGLRHSGISIMAATAPEATQAFARHTNPRMTLRYTHTAPQTLRNAVDQMAQRIAEAESAN